MSERSIVIGPYTVELHHEDGTKTVISLRDYANCTDGDLFANVAWRFPDAERIPGGAKTSG